MKKIWYVLICVVVALIGIFVINSFPMSIVGTWYGHEEAGIDDVLVFYENGTGYAYGSVNKGVLSASDFGMTGYIKTLAIGFYYTQIKDNVYSATATDFYIESYTGESVYYAEGQIPESPLGTFTLMRVKYVMLIWDGGDGDETVVLSKRG